MRLILLAIILCCIPIVTFARTVKTNHVDVNLWSEPGRDSAEKLDQIQRYEEVEVRDTKKLANGETWIKVELRRLPGWRATSKTGWVDAKFFNEITTPVSDDQPSEIDSADKDCKSNQPNLKGATKPFKEIAKSIDREQKTVGPKSSKGFIWPTVGTVRSGFGMRRHPITGVVKLHNGTDIAGNNAKPVLAAQSGTVRTAQGGCQTGVKSCNGGAGNFIVIDHGNGTQTKYLHLNPSCPLPKNGASVQQGDTIACVGSTGASTGPHLHFGVVLNGKYVNPLTVLPQR
jgi:murein DD-endopeptidase MepM/ murein hydrolase activator NlpD